MPRKKKVDGQVAIAGALNVFWQSGYAGTGTRDIEEQTGITKFTLQTTYGGKEGLFLETLDAYLDNAEAKHFPNKDTFGVEDLAVWFEKLVSPEQMPMIGHSGCLAFNSIGSFDRANERVNQRIHRYLHAFEERVVHILNRAAERGELAAGSNPKDMAQILVTQLLGLHVLMKARESDGVPREFGATCSKMIRSWMR